MIAEMRTCLLKPKTPQLVEQRFQSALPARVKLSRLAAFWHVDIGTINQVIQLWPYESLAQREEVEKQAVKIPGWPPDVRDYILEENSQILVAAPFSPPLAERQSGGIYEIRIYTYRAGSIPKVIERWSPLMEPRMKLSPVVGCWYTESGLLNRWVHIWAYQDFAERQRVRAEAARRGIWPPDTAEWMLKQEVSIAIPAPFSPLR